MFAGLASDDRGYIFRRMAFGSRTGGLRSLLGLDRAGLIDYAPNDYGWIDGWYIKRMI